MPSQVPIAIVGMACRLPGHCNSPRDLWDFLVQGKIAANQPPHTRFALSGHYDSSGKPYTMKTPGAMFIEDMDPADFDAQFFNINHAEASSMDPQQRGLMEISYECLESAGIPIESLKGQRVGCLVGASAVDYHDMNCRDPEDRTDSPTMGSSRALLSNRISHFLDVRGPSMTIDTACSSSLTALDMACHYLGANNVDAILVGGVNIYLSPERNQDMGAMRATASPSGRCHSFDSKADGYVVAEGLNMVYLKRLEDAIRDNDPIRAVIRGTSVNSAGKTPGIAMPSATAQAEAIRSAYANSGISEDELSGTGFVECHATGTLVGDPAEVEGVGSVFALTRPTDQPLAIGSIKGNIGHSEAAAGLSSLIKVVLSIENEMIPGTATFQSPSPKIDFENARVKAFRHVMKWPRHTKIRASINSFGFGGANAHAVIESAKYLQRDPVIGYKSSYLNVERVYKDFFDEEPFLEPSKSIMRHKVIVLSANHAESLEASIKALSSHMLNPGVNIELNDLAYTLSERRSRLYHRAYSLQVDDKIARWSFVRGRCSNQTPKIGFIFTGQGAQYPLMGRLLFNSFPAARRSIENLDAALTSLQEPPAWTLVSALTEQFDPRVLREPEFSQPIVTALQLAYLQVLSDWGITPSAVIGHSSREIASAVAAGFLVPEEAIRIAYLRGQAAKHLTPIKPLGMLAIGASAEITGRYIDPNDDLVQIACFNSPRSVTCSGTVESLKRLRDRVLKDSIFARILKVDFAYHSDYMTGTGKHYLEMLQAQCGESYMGNNEVAMFSSVTGKIWESTIGATYWARNMMSQVQFDQGLTEMIENTRGATFLIEIGPSDALAGPVSQICEEIHNSSTRVSYTSVARRGSDNISDLYSVAGKIFLAGGIVDLCKVNEYNVSRPSIIVDLPHYAWNHSVKYWHESLASKDWRYRPFPRHDLLGTKIIGTLWHTPSWKNKISLNDNPWLRDHKLGDKIVFPGAAYICLAMEAMFQRHYMTVWNAIVPQSYNYRFRDIRFLKALVFDGLEGTRTIMLTLMPVPGPNSSWFHFTVTAISSDVWNNHVTGFVQIETDTSMLRASEHAISPLKHPTTAGLWYTSLRDTGFDFGPSFQRLSLMEYTETKRFSRCTVLLDPPSSKWPQSNYTIHPASLDGCFQTVIPAAWAGDRTKARMALVPSQIDSLLIPSRPQQCKEAVSVAHSYYVGVGRKDLTMSYASSCSVYHPVDGSLIIELSGLRYTELELIKDVGLQHTYGQLVWEADITLLSEKHFRQLADATVGDLSSDPFHQTLAVARKLIDMIAHKTPSLSVKELNLGPVDISSLWFDESRPINPMRAAYSRYKFQATIANSVAVAQEMYSKDKHTEFELLDLELSRTETRPEFDLIIAKFAEISESPTMGLSQALKVITNSLKDGGLALIFDLPSTSKLEQSLLSPHRLNIIWEYNSLIVTRVGELPIPRQSKDISIVSFTGYCAPRIQEGLKQLGFNAIDAAEPREIKTESTVLVLDEVMAPVLSEINKFQWKTLQHLVKRNCKLLWLTKNAQMSISNPDSALASGLFRVIRRELSLSYFITLDIEHDCGENAVNAIATCLQLLDHFDGAKAFENEFVERHGILYISRIIPNVTLNKLKEEQSLGMAAEITDFQATETIIRLQTDQVGSFDSLYYSEVAADPISLDTDSVDITVVASGVNFKDVASVTGLIPENEHLLGGEGSGIINRIGPEVKDFRPGQRVAFFKRGSFGNRVQARSQLVHSIPDSMSFEEAATLPCVFMTSIYSLFNLAGIKRGDRVLIHSATGGVGMSAIQLCLCTGAIVYATVGTHEKREFLKSKFGIPDERIFSSRTRAFGQQIMDHTDGKGVNIILNSLAGDLLDESWRIISDGGTMVEIGKRDIIERNTLSMRPFNRNASFRALDLSHEQISDETVASLLSFIFELLEKGAIEPISPIHTFSFAEVPKALRMMSGNHIGKLVISNTSEAHVKIPVRRAQRPLRFRNGVSYLICGGLQGLCSSLAVYLATHGARYLTVMSRSLQNDQLSQKTVYDIRQNGCEVRLIQGDVTLIDDVRKAFQFSEAPVGGIIHGAMIIRDRTFAAMTVEDYHIALGCKVQGTWNLHKVSLERKLDLEFFTLMSSIAGIYGSPGQANYAAANSFLDAFASYRNTLGLAACSVDLGVVKDIGYMAGNMELQSRYDDAIWHRIDERLLREIFEFTVRCQVKLDHDVQTTSNIVTGIRFPQPDNSPMMQDARFSGLYSRGRTSPQSRTKDGSKECDELRIAMRSKINFETVVNMAIRVLNGFLMKSLRLSESMDCARPLSIYGIDSLSAIEFRNFIKVEFDVEITTLDVLNAPSLVFICEKIIKEFSVS